VDGSILHLREFVDVEITIDCLTYVYHYMDAQDSILVFSKLETWATSGDGIISGVEMNCTL
jgi:hypothetical protein